ncbi:MAG: bifunctional adenosylcobinamide kinase/adenosylcobinamide-phosphate guanylyltransferase [Magnetococcus sp. DMHC-8]
MSTHLILGGARSGKSAFAARLATESGLPVLFVATARATDAEMTQRIRQHQASRPAHWQLLEEPVQLGSVLATHAGSDRLLLVDCLTLWLTNLLLHEDASRLEQERAALCQALHASAGPVLLVSNETGLGVVPMGALTRRFVDENGLLNQQLAQYCTRVTWVVAGLPLSLKG